jgi:hypothetical protein
MRYVSILSRSGLVLWMPIAASCDQADEPNEDRAATSSASPSPTESLVPAVCDYAEELREVLKDVDEGTELPEDLVMSLGESRAVLAEQAEIDFNPATAEALEDPETAVGRLKVSIADAGTDYRTDFPVRANLLTVRITMKTVRHHANC